MSEAIMAAIIVTCLLMVFWTGFLLGFIVNRPRRPNNPAIPVPWTLGADDDVNGKRRSMREDLAEQATKRREGLVNDVLKGITGR